MTRRLPVVAALAVALGACSGGEPAQHPSFRAVDVAAGGFTTCARATTGKLFCWGLNQEGQVGIGNTEAVQPFPQEVPFVAKLRQLALGFEHTCAVTADGALQCWGGNDAGQLGIGVLARRTRPIPVTGVRDVVEVAAGSLQTWVRRKDGAVLRFGAVRGSQPGRAPTPEVVEGLARAVQIAVGIGHACARMPDGTARCWGNGNRGQLGDGSLTDEVAAPGVTVALTGIAELALGEAKSCARLTDGTVQCWGYNFAAGTAGEPELLPRPRAVRGLAGVVQLTGAESHFCARTADFEVRCWGSRDHGQIGDGKTAADAGRSTPIPTRVPGLRGVRKIASGRRHTCALLEGGLVRCWGSNEGGALGDGSTAASRASPVAVRQ